MRKEGWIVVIIFVLLVIVLSIVRTPPLGEEVASEVLVEGLDTVWAIDFLPDGRMIFTERPGRVSVFDGSELRVVGEIGVSEISESGLSGIAVDPNFDSNMFVYIYYTHETANRVSRFVFSESVGLTDERILLDDIPSAPFHDGGRLKFGPDGKLYITTGDATDPSSAQDLDSLAGKILRMNSDGSIPEDNPFGNLVWSYGHRNSQGFDWSDSGILYEAEHGPTRNDEINIIERGENYGWPVECDEIHEENEIVPIRCFKEFTLAPGAIAVYKGDLYVAGLRGAQLRRLILSTDGMDIVEEQELFSELGRIREVVSRDGFLYIGTSNRDGRGVSRPGDDKIIRVKIGK